MKGVGPISHLSTTYCLIADRLHPHFSTLTILGGERLSVAFSVCPPHPKCDVCIISEQCDTLNNWWVTYLLKLSEHNVDWTTILL